MLRISALVVATLIAALGIILPQTLAVLWPEYDSFANFLSELGGEGAPHADIMNRFGFLPLGILWGFAILLTAWRSPSGPLLLLGAMLLLGNSISYIGAAIYPCDAGCPLRGSASQTMHNLLGIVGYLTVPPGLIALGIHYRGKGLSLPSGLCFAAATAALCGFAGMLAPDLSSYRGAFQRLADFSGFVWLWAVAIALPARA